MAQPQPRASLRAPHRAGPGARPRHRHSAPLVDRRARGGGLRADRLRGRDHPRRASESYRVAAPSRCWCRGRRRRCARGSAPSVRVRVGARRATGATWSEPATVEAGLLDAADWAARFVSPGEHRRPGRAGPDRRRPPRACPGRSAAARLYATAHGVYVARAQRPAGRRPACSPPAGRAYQHRLRYQTYDVTDLVRAGRATRSRCCSATAGTAAGSASDRRAGALRRPARAAGPARGRRPPTAPVHVLATDGVLDRAREPDPRRRPLRRAAHRPAPRAPRRRLGGRRRSRPIARPARRARRPAGAGHADCSRPPVWTSPAADARRLRPEPRRLGPAARPRRARPARGRRAARRGARGRRSSARGRCARAKATDTYVLAGPRARSCSSRRSPSTASATPRSPASATLRAEDIEAVVVGSDLRRTGWFACVARAAQPVPRERRLEHARQLRRRARPTARSATSGSAGPATSRSSRPTATFLFDTAGLPRLLAGRPGRRAAARTASVPARHPGRRSRRRAPAAAALGRRRDDRALGALPAHRRPRRCSSASCRACAPGSTRSPRWPAPTGCGPAASSSATGSTRRAPPERPGQAKADPDVVATAYLARSAEIVAERPRCSAATTTRDATRSSPPRSAAAFARAYRDAGRAGCMTDAQTVVRARARSGTCCPTAEQRAHAGRPAGRPRARRRVPDQHRLRRHPADLPTR